MSADVIGEPRYIDHFWGDKHNGYQVLYDNVKKSDDVVSEVTQLIKERLSIEDEYAKALNRSVQRVCGFINSGSTFEPVWVLTKGTMELLAEIHAMFVKNLQDLTREVARYKEDLLKNRKELKKLPALEAVSLMQTTTTCLQKAKETYHTRYSELEKLRKESSHNGKEVAKAEVKASKARDEYRSYVEKYETVRVRFEETMEEACSEFESFDRSVYIKLQQSMLMFASQLHETAQSSLQVSAQFRESLQQVGVDRFIEKVVLTKGTGSERPAHTTFEEVDPGAHIPDPPITSSLPTKDIIDLISVATSDPSSCSSSGVLPQEPISTTQSKSIIDLLTMDPPDPPISQPPKMNDDFLDRKISMPNFSSSNTNLAAPTKKFSLFTTKRKKKESQSSVDDEPAGGIFNKFTREKRGSRKSVHGDDHTGNLRASVCFDDAQSTTSSSKSDEKTLNHLLDAPIDQGVTKVDDEGYVIREKTVEQQEDTNWSSCSSSEDEEEMQKSRIRALTIRPVDKLNTKNASVDELRDAIGSMQLTRSTTFDKDPWLNSRPPPQFSQSMSGTSFRHPLKTHHTADGMFRTKFSESDYDESNVPPSFSVSMGYNAGMSGMARARPRSNTPTHSTINTSTTNGLRKESTGSLVDAWGSTFNLNTSESSHSFGESTFNLSQSTGNLLQATISEQRVPLAMALNEFSHVWFKKADFSQCVHRIFGTVMISFASSSIRLLTQYQNDFEPLAFTLSNASRIKTILPNKQLLDDLLTVKDEETHGYTFTFNKSQLANWLKEQQTSKPEAGFYNAEVARYELRMDETIKPPLYLSAYWKFEPAHTDLRVDYRLNTDSPITTPMLNVQFTTDLAGQFESVTSDPDVQWNKEKSNLTWTVLEISRHGEVGGSLKARASVSNPSPEVSLEMINRKPAQVFAQFQCHDANLSGVDVGLVPSDIYHLSMVRKKVIAGKYFCDPELRQ